MVGIFFKLNPSVNQKNILDALEENFPSSINYWVLTSGPLADILALAGTLTNNVQYHFKAPVSVSFQYGY